MEPMKEPTRKYSIQVITTDQQVVDPKQSYYVRDRNPSPRRIPSEGAVIKNKCMVNPLDEQITEAIRTNKSFDSIIKNLNVESYLKQEKSTI